MKTPTNQLHPSLPEAASRAPLSGLALAAWREIAPDSPSNIDHVELVKGRKHAKAIEKAAVYRLCGAGPGRSHVIAKRAKSGAGHVEQTIYEKILPKIPVTKLEYYGAFPEETGEFVWLFFEDAGPEAYSPKIGEHRALASRWLATMHLSSEALSGSIDLPNRGPLHYLKHLRHARETILKNQDNPSLDTDFRYILDSILAHFDRLEAAWAQIEETCAAFPRTLVHGDFVEKNVRVRRAGSALELFPFDWETAGWGAPAADIARFSGKSVSPDLEDYVSRVLRDWRDIEHADFVALARVGTLFRMIAAISWECESLPFSWVRRLVPSFQSYETRLARATSACSPWANG